MKAKNQEIFFYLEKSKKRASDSRKLGNLLISFLSSSVVLSLHLVKRLIWTTSETAAFFAWLKTAENLKDVLNTFLIISKKSAMVISVLLHSNDITQHYPIGWDGRLARMQIAVILPLAIMQHASHIIVPGNTRWRKRRRLKIILCNKISILKYSIKLMSRVGDYCHT